MPLLAAMDTRVDPENGPIIVRSHTVRSVLVVGKSNGQTVGYEISSRKKVNDFSSLPFLEV